MHTDAYTRTGMHTRPGAGIAARMNADLNAADNILKRGLDHLIGLDEAGHTETEPDAQPAYRGKDASAMTCETSTR